MMSMYKMEYENMRMPEKISGYQVILIIWVGIILLCMNACIT